MTDVGGSAVNATAPRGSWSVGSHRRWFGIGPVEAVTALAALALVAGLGVALVRTWWPTPTRCEVLASTVSGLGSFRWSNGVTESGSAWSQVLGEGVTDAAPDERAGLAQAVRADPDGYARFRAALPAESAAAADRLHRLVLDPAAASARATNPAVVRDAASVRRPGGQECGFAP